MAFQIYKAGQGEKVRHTAATVAGLLLVYGCYSLYQYLLGFADLGNNLTNAFGDDVPINFALFISIAVFAGGGFGLFSLYNKPSVAEFLIDTESELGKVSWSTWKEVVSHSTVVVVTVVILGLYIGLLDKGLFWCRNLIWGS